MTLYALVQNDGALIVELPWTEIHRIQDAQRSPDAPQLPGLPTKIGLPLNLMPWAAYLENMTGIVGNVTVSLVPGGNKHLVAEHQKAFDPPLRPGERRLHPEGVIFPGRFEADWRTGVIAGWLQAHRPDLLVPPDKGRR